MKSFDKEQLVLKKLSERKSKINLENFIEPSAEPPRISKVQMTKLESVAELISNSRKKKAPVIFSFGAHLVKNGLSLVLNDLMERGYVQHLLGNGAVSIHDWEIAYQGKTAEDVRKYLSEGQFGLWDETGRYINEAINYGAKHNLGLGESVGKFILKDKIGKERTFHKFKKFSILAKAYEKNIPFSICIGIGQDIIQAHPSCDGACLGKTSYTDFLRFAATVQNLENGVFLSIGSAVMSPMVFEKTLSMAKNVARSKSKKLENYSIIVNDIQPSNWNWSKGEPPTNSPDYYLRFFKSFNRMGGDPRYIEMDNVAFLRNLSLILD